MKKSKISSLSELQEERKRLRLITEVTKREMSHSLDFIGNETKKVVLNNLAVPLGATAAAGFLLNKLIKPSERLQTKTKSTSNILSTTVAALIPFAIKFLDNQNFNQKNYNS